MYGSFRCPHCYNQKELFENSFQYVEYVECAIPDTGEQSEACQKAEIGLYPTWKFADGRKIEGELTLEQLSKLSGCPLPK